MTCECFDKMDARLAEHNGRTARGFAITETNSLQLVRFVATVKIDKSKRKPVPEVCMRYCPFCGKPLDKSEGAATS